MMMKKKEILQSLLKLVVIVFAATVLGKIFTGLGFPETNIVVMYLLAVSSGCEIYIRISVWDFICSSFTPMLQLFFTEPYHTLAVNDPGYLITFSIMLTTSILTSALTTKEKLLTEEANERGKKARSYICFPVSCLMRRIWKLFSELQQKVSVICFR